MQKKFHQIAIDGPAGAGKSTVAKKVAEALGYCYLDTGAMYRVIAYKALASGTPLDNEYEITRLARQTKVYFSHDGSRSVYCDGQDVTESIRSAEVSRAVSVVAAYPGVREEMVKLQRQEAEKANVVMDGRDIGTNVLTNAEYKFFMTASPAERAKRRWLELKEKGVAADLAQVEADIIQRDHNDSTRKLNPLKKAEDAIELDTTGMTVEEVTQKILEVMKWQP